MRIGHISFRLAGSDGVSLESAKLTQILARMGHSSYYFAGELDPLSTANSLIEANIEDAILVPEAHFTHPEAIWLTKHAFGVYSTDPPAGTFRYQNLQERVDPLPRREVSIDHRGPATIESYTVMYGEEEPEIGHAACLLEDGRRVVQREDGVRGAAELEGPHPLQILAFEEELGVDQGQARPAVAPEALGGEQQPVTVRGEVDVLIRSAGRQRIEGQGEVLRLGARSGLDAVQVVVDPVGDPGSILGRGRGGRGNRDP